MTRASAGRTGLLTRTPLLVRTGLLLAAGALGAVSVTGCGLIDEQVDSLVPSAVGEDQYTISATFSDVLNLPDGAVVKLDGVKVGKVVQIDPADYQATVTMAIDDDVEILSGYGFRLRYTTALGEVYVEVTASGDGEPLSDGDEVPEDNTSVATTVEDALASASLLVNGGNLAQIETIVTELNTALDGRTDSASDLITQTDIFLSEVLASTEQIDGVLDALAAASQTLNDRESTINEALAELEPAAETLTENTDDLATLLESVDSLSVTADDLVTATRDDLVQIVDELGPVLDTLLAAKDELLPALDDLATFSATIDDRTTTDYLNLFFKLRVTSALSSVVPTVSDIADTAGG